MADKKTGDEEISHPAAQMMVAGMTVFRAENETQQAMAIARPRNQELIFAGAKRELELAPDFAKGAWYSIPFNESGGEGKRNVEGPSIKAAMALLRWWGNCTNAARIIEDQGDRIVVEGVFLDYETNMRTLRTVTVAKRAWNKKMQAVVPLREDRLTMAIQAGMSKAVRNAVLASLPAALVESYIAHAKKVAAGEIKGGGKKELSVKEKIEHMRAMFKKNYAVTEGQLNSYIAGLTVESDDELLASLMGSYNAIRDQQATVEQVFGATELEAAKQTPPPGQLPSAKELVK